MIKHIELLGGMAMMFGGLIIACTDNKAVIGGSALAMAGAALMSKGVVDITIANQIESKVK